MPGPASKLQRKLEDKLDAATVGTPEWYALLNAVQALEVARYTGKKPPKAKDPGKLKPKVPKQKKDIPGSSSKFLEELRRSQKVSLPNVDPPKADS